MEGDGKVRFAAKSLGDYSAGLTDRLTVGESLVTEGPYGSFDYEDDSKRQVWVAGGVGLTPFVARLEELAARGGAGYPVDLFHSNRRADPDVVSRLKQAATEAGVSLHVVESPVDGPLTVERLADVVRDWKDTSTWFGGPAGFAEAIRHRVAIGYPGRRRCSPKRGEEFARVFGHRTPLFSIPAQGPWLAARARVHKKCHTLDCIASRRLA